MIPSRRLAAVMFTDIVGYTALMQESEETARVARVCHREALEGPVASHGGELVQYLGDGSLSTFPSVVAAVSAAIQVQAALRSRLPLRIGIHQGEITSDEQGVYGDSVNVAARVMGLATAGSVLVSDKAGDELKNQPGLSVFPLGAFALKNVRRPVGIGAVEAGQLPVPARRDLLASADSTKTYEEISTRWPRIAVAVALFAFILGALSGGAVRVSSLQSYVFSWSAATVGIWFLFDKAELAMSQDSRDRLAAWLRQPDLAGLVDSLAAQFSILFDRVFGERHLSWRCFGRSAIASMITVWVVCLLWTVRHPPPSVAAALVLLMAVTLAGIVVNLVPDYLSLLETRFLLGRLAEGGRLLPVLLLDLLATTALGFSGILLIALVGGGDVSDLPRVFRNAVSLRSAVTVEPRAGVDASVPLGLFFYSTFFTSAWLWVYAASVLGSRALTALNHGVGFLLRATDVEYHPFRAIGFVSVGVVSLMFALALPVLLF